MYLCSYMACGKTVQVVVAILLPTTYYTTYYMTSVGNHFVVRTTSLFYSELFGLLHKSSFHYQ